MGSVFFKMPQNTANFFSRGGILFLFVFRHSVMLAAFLFTQLFHQLLALLSLDNYG